MDPDLPQHVVIHAAKRSMTREQKAGFGFVVVSGCLTVLLGLFYVIKHVSAPFLITYEGPVFETTAEKQAKAIAEQQKKDTDGDGLNDYDELYVYKTSAYLADTDSDGYNDSSELSSGTDPNCPVGADCENTLSNSNATAGSSGGSGFADSLAVPAGATTDSTAAFTPEIANLTVAQIRELLVQSGADQATVDSLSDAEIQELYDATLAQLNTATVSDTGTETTDTTTTP